jgi:hypothetical protein
MKNIRIKKGLSVFWAMLFVIFYLVISFSSVNGQCDFNKISAATNLYEFGKFEDAKQYILPCLISKSFRELNDINRALRLLSLIAIAEDSLIKAEDYIKSIILNDPKFTSDPHLIFDPLFKKLLEPLQTVKVYSVSKNAEDIQTAPASVI